MCYSMNITRKDDAVKRDIQCVAQKVRIRKLVGKTQIQNAARYIFRSF